MRMVWTALLCGTLSLSGRGRPPPVARPCPTSRPPRVSRPCWSAASSTRCASRPWPPAAALSRCRKTPRTPGTQPSISPSRRARAESACCGGAAILAGRRTGQAATDLYASYAGAFARVNRNHDIVLVDQRGTGRSAPLKCAYPDEWQAPRTRCCGCVRQLSTASGNSGLACASTPPA